MSDKLWLIVGKLTFPMHEISAQEMEEIKSDPDRTKFQSYPLYWAKGHGVYPIPVSECHIVREITQDEI